MACSKYSYTAAAGVNDTDLCDDLLIGILTRLPAKSLFRSKCVSKSWRRLISSDHIQKKLPFTFSGIYSNHSGEDSTHRYACMSDGKFIDCNLNFFPFRSDSRIISCCNGLLLFHSLSPQVFHICNPATKRWLTLPSANKPSLLSLLVFDPCLSPYYKVICFAGWRTHGAELEVFSSDTGKWVEFDVQWGVESVTMSPVMSYFDGALYILSHSHCIVCIHVETMMCQKIELPEPAGNGAHLGKSGGHLCYYSGNDNSELIIWTLENNLDTYRWALKHCNCLKTIAEQESSTLGSSRFLAFHPESHLVYFVVAGRVVSYDMRNKRIEEVGDFGMERERGYLVQIWIFQFSSYIADCLSKE